MSEIEKAVMTLRVRRGGPETAHSDAPHYDSFTLPYEPGASVLDALIWIRAAVDPSLAVRYACVSANACKECMVQVDGKTVYACTERLSAGTMTIEPLPNKILIRDLATDIVPPKETLAAVAAARARKA